MSNRTIRLFAYLRRPVKPRVRGRRRAGAFNGGAGRGNMRVRAGSGLPYSRKAPRGCPYPGRGRGRGDLVEAGSSFRARVRGRAGPGRSMTVRARSRCVSGETFAIE